MTYYYPTVNPFFYMFQNHEKEDNVVETEYGQNSNYHADTTFYKKKIASDYRHHNNVTSIFH